jgi:monoamine oxidase
LPQPDLVERNFVGLSEFFTAVAANDRIHFAGEHLSAYPSWMQGLWRQG